MNAEAHTPSDQYRLIASAISFLTQNADSQPSLNELGAHLGMSEFHVQRLFVEWAGVSPKEFLQAITLERAKKALRHSGSLLEATYDLGLSSSSRLHDLFITTEAMSPGEFKGAGKNVVIRWSAEDTPFGRALFAETDKGLCHLAFVDDEASAIAELSRKWPSAELQRDPCRLRSTVEEITSRMTGKAPGATLGVLLRGTPFRLKVWRALLDVPMGALVSYQGLARMAGSPSAVRAAAGSVAENPLAFLIPCHRVIRQTGVFGRYHWGEERKLAMVGRELAGS